MNPETRTTKIGDIEIPEKYQALFKSLLQKYEATHGPQTDEKKQEIVKAWMKVAKIKEDRAREEAREHTRESLEKYEDLTEDYRATMELSGSTAGKRDLEDE